MTETVVENTQKHTTYDLEIIFRGSMPPHIHRIFSHAQFHQSLDSYSIVLSKSFNWHSIERSRFRIFRYKLNSALFACSTCFFIEVNFRFLFRITPRYLNSLSTSIRFILRIILHRLFNSVAKNKNFRFVIVYIKFPLVAKISKQL